MPNTWTLCVIAAALLPFATPALSSESQPAPLEERLMPGETPPDRQETDNTGQPGSVAVNVEVQTAPPVFIRAIKFEGVDVPVEVADAARPFIARTATVAVLEQLAAAMTDAYEKSNIALFTIAIPEQSFENGIVRVLVAEGHVETVTLAGEVEGENHKLVTAFAERLTKEKPATRRTLERQLSLIRDIPGLETEPSFSYGARTGAVGLTLALDYQKPQASFGFTNRSSRFVKDGQFSGEGKVFRLLRDGDLTTLKLVASVNFEDSRYASLQHSTPLGASGARADLGAAVLQSRPSGTPIEGDAQLYAAGVSYPVIRSYKENLSVRAGFDIVNSDNAALGSLIATERTRAAGFSTAYSRSWEKRSVKISATAKQGLPMLNARVSDLIGEPEYFKARLDVSILQRIGDDFRFTLNTSAQWTDDMLPANERFSVGGAKFGRAFSAGLVNADRGGAILVEPAWRPINEGDFARSEIYAFADYAYVETFARQGGDNQYLDLGSFGGGARMAYKDNGYLELEMARAYDQPVIGFDQDWRFSASWRINIRP